MPENWAWCRLGEAGEIITGNTPSKSNDEYYGNEYPFFKPTDLDNGYFVTEAQDNLSIKGFEISRKLPKKSILVTCIGATIGKTGFIRKEGTCNQQINAIIANKLVFSEYIYLQCISPYFQNEIIKNASATTLPIINKSKFEKLFLPLPPLSEQKRIVVKVEELLALVEDLETNKTDLKSTIQQTKAKVLDMAIRGELVPQNRDDEPASVLLERIKNEQQSAKSKKRNTAHNTHYDNDKLLMVNDEFPFEIPENWAWCRLGEIGEVISGGTPQTSNENYWNGDVSWITPADLSNYKEKYISRGKRNISMEGLENSSAKIIRRGSVLFSSRAPIGYVAISEKEVSTNQGFKSISPYIENSEHYIYYFLLAEKENISMKASGTTFKELSGTEFGKIIFPLPPLAEQRRIVEKIEHIFSVLDELEENLS
ncbi:restriction endonuclease subunit S [Capnocytophaga canis]|uniref:restriction endonuclease subunit S n=1 Tax=Capnocytophaga canis TaxID=1848903 RepID=UPI0021001C30|nr:restriction endonuclease subunit S [Capnocytophaga canis]